MLKFFAVLVAFAFASLGSVAAKPANIVMMIGEDEYHTWESLPEFAASDLKAAGYHVTIIHADPANKNNFPGIEAALHDADLLLVSVRRRTPIKAQLDAVRAHLAAGKPLVGIRTACHAFSPLPKEKITDPNLAMWTTFDPEVLGGNYVGHHRGENTTTVTLASGAAANPILRGITVEKLIGHSPLYRVSPLAADATPLLIGTFATQPPEPIAWTHLYGAKHARVFFTSFGGPEDFKNAEFRKLLANGIQWGLAKK